MERSSSKQFSLAGKLARLRKVKVDESQPVANADDVGHDGLF
jgi:hypothetical protein